jgi:peptidoglycan hydrolase CwlO-like protein
MRIPFVSYLLSISLLVACFISGIDLASAADDLATVRAEANRRLGDLQSAENMLVSDINTCNQEIEKYNQRIAAKQAALKQVQDEIKKIELAMRWF